MQIIYIYFKKEELMVSKRKDSTDRALHHPRHNFALPEDPASVFVVLSHACPAMVPTLSTHRQRRHGEI